MSRQVEEAAVEKLAERLYGEFQKDARAFWPKWKSLAETHQNAWRHTARDHLTAIGLLGQQGEAEGRPFLIDKARRKTLIDGLAKLDYGFADDLHAELEATRCKSCGGNGYAPYVGGDDDDALCLTCEGTGFDSSFSTQPLPESTRERLLEIADGLDWREVYGEASIRCSDPTPCPKCIFEAAADLAGGKR